MAVATRLFTPEVTAASFRMEALVRALAAEADVTVLTTRPPVSARASGADAPARVSVRRWPVLRDASGAIRGYAQYMSFDVPLVLRLLLTRSDVIVAEAPPTTGCVAAVIGRLLGRPLIYYPGDVWSDAVASTDAPTWVVRVMAAIERFVVRRSARVIAVSPEVRERLVALGAEASAVHEVGNGIDTAVFHPGVTSPPVDRPYFVYTGTMSEWQRPEVFIRALATIADADAEIRFFGQGSAEKELRALAEELLPGRVHFGGIVPPHASASWIRGAVAALVSIVPGIGYDFARPTKTYAAAAVGTPVLFAGPRTGAELVASAALGESSEFGVEEVAVAMRALLAQAEDGTTERMRAQRVEWAAQNVSWTTVGARAAEVVQGVLRGTRDAGR